MYVVYATKNSIWRNILNVLMEIASKEKKIPEKYAQSMLSQS